MNATFAKFVGTHTFKMGADYRRIGVYLLNPGNASGEFQFDKELTSSTGLNQNSTTEGDAYASFLLGYPTADAARQSTMTLTTPLDIFTNYVSGYWQDDWRVGSRFTLNYGLRIEHEGGIREADNNITVGFDPKVTSALSSVVIPAAVDPSGGTASRTVAGGLIYAGVDGNNLYQGNPPSLKWSPRVGAVYSLNTKTVLRADTALLGPWNYPVPSSVTSNYGQIGFTQNTVSPQTAGTPMSPANPFPTARVARGSSLVRWRPGRHDDHFVDRTAPRRGSSSTRRPSARAARLDGRHHQLHRRARDHLPLGGTDDTVVNINQLDRSTGARLGSPQQAVTIHSSAMPVRSAVEPATLTAANYAPIRSSERQARRFPKASTLQRGVVEWSSGRPRAASRTRQLHLQRAEDNQIGEANFSPTAATACRSTTQLRRVDAGVRGDKLRRVLHPIVDTARRARRAAPRDHRADLAAAVRKDRRFGTRAASRRLAALDGVRGVTCRGGFDRFTQRQHIAGGANRRTSPARLRKSGDFADRWRRLTIQPQPGSTRLPSAPLRRNLRNAPRLLTDVRRRDQEHRRVVVEEHRAERGKSAQVKVEVINLFNRVQTTASTSPPHAA